MPLPYQKQAVKARGRYLTARNPKGVNRPRVVKLKLTPYRRKRNFFGEDR